MSAMRTAAICLSLAAAACSARSELPACAERSGSYALHFEELPGGTCGPLKDSGERIEGVSVPVSPCSGSGHMSADGCVTATDAICPGTDHGVAIVGERNRTTWWSTDGASGRALLTTEVRYANGSGTYCASSYEVTLHRAAASDTGSSQSLARTP
jgi:hypothetical protein